MDEIATRHKEWLDMARYHGAKNPADVVQDVYLKLMEKQNRDGCLNINAGYMWLAIRSTTYKSHEPAKAPIHENLKTDNHSLNESAYQDLHAHVQQALHDLPDYHTTIFMHMVQEGLSERELARRTGISRRSIRHTKEIVREYINARCAHVLTNLWD